MVEVRIWWSAADAPSDVEAVLTVEERERLSRFVRRADQDRFRSAHVLVRALVGDLVGVDARQIVVAQACEQCGGAHGRPVVTVAGQAGPPVSLAHAGGLVVVATAASPVGIDVEPLGAIDEAVARVALSVREQAQWTELPPEERAPALARWWVRKEAVLKATGFGVGFDPTDVEVSAPQEPPSLVGWRGAGRPRSLRMSDLSIDEHHVAAVAVLTRQPLQVSIRHSPLSQLRW